MSVININFSDFLAALALLASVSAFYVSLSSAKLQEKRFMGDAEVVINSDFKNGEVLVGGAALSASIAEIRVCLPDEVEPLKTYSVRAGEPWINKQTSKFIRNYFEMSVDRFLEAMINGWIDGFEDHFANRPLKIDVPFETVIGVYVRSRSMGEDQKMYASYKVKAVHKINRNEGVYTKFRWPISRSKRGLTNDTTEILSVQFLRKIELPENGATFTSLLKNDLIIPDANNFGQLEFYVGRELFPYSYRKDD